MKRSRLKSGPRVFAEANLRGDEDRPDVVLDISLLGWIYLDWESVLDFVSA